MNNYALVVQVLGLDRLDQTMGKNVVDSVLADLAPRLSALTAGVLSLAEASGVTESLDRGHWATPFSMGGDSLLREDLQQQIFSMNAAAGEIANEAALEIFGPDAASQARLTAVCIKQRGPHGPEYEIKSPADTILDSKSRASLQKIIDGNLIRTFLQPIVALPSGQLVGFEALSRGPLGSRLEGADQLFGAAASCGLTRALEMACATQAIQYLDRLPEPLWLSINASAATAAALREVARRGGIDCWRLVVELTERLPLGSIEELRVPLDGLRSLGARIALDDSGCGYADLEAAASLETDVLKFCMTVIRRLQEQAEARSALAEAVGNAHSHGSLVLAEGVETPHQARILAGIGVDLAQGWLYGKPFPANELGSWLHAESDEGSGPLRVA